MAGCRVDAFASHPLNSASASKCATSAYRGPITSCLLAPLLKLSLIRRLVVASPVVTCLHLASPFVMQPPHASILDPSSLFAPAGCYVASLCTASAYRCAAASRLAVLMPSPMRRHLCRRCNCDCHPRCIPSSWCHCPRCCRCRRPLPSLLLLVIVVVDVTHCALAIIVNFADRRAVAIVVVASSTSSLPVVPSP